MTGLILAVLLLFGSTVAAADVDFDTWFTGDTLRIDLYRTGDHDSDLYSLDNIKIEGPWPGTRTKLIDTLNRGFFLYSVYDNETGTLLYTRGFSSVFGEWLTTDEAKQRKRTIGETARIPRPKNTFDLTVSKRDDNNVFFEIYRVTIDPNNHNVCQDKTYADCKVIDLHVPAEPHKVFDIVFLPEGYTAAEADKLRNDAERMAKVLLETKPYNELADKIAIRVVEAFSRESGIDQPREGIWKDTLLDARFNAFDSARYVLTENNKAIADVASSAPYDVVLIMLNTERYGGGGIYNAYACFAVDNEWGNYLMTHEGGHSMSGLGDEYYTSDVAYTDFYKPTAEPWEPNITALLDPENLKWKEFVTPGTPIPTPATDEYKNGVVGAFEGAGYMAKGLYRPCFDCKMLSRANIDYCPVCMAAVRQAIIFYTEE
jgi:hypothetical protein